MEPEERTYRTLVVSSSARFNDSLRPLLLAGCCESPVFADSVAAAKRAVLENAYDFVVINAPLPDDPGTRFAIDAGSSGSTVCLLLVRTELAPDLRAKVTPHGVFLLSKPTSRDAFAEALAFMAAAHERLRNLEKKTVSIEEKMKEIRLCNRAKWLLIEHLGMSEQDAHRYMEKQAMDACLTRREIAEGIIRTYG